MEMKTDFRKPVPARERCIVKIGEPGNLRECGAATEYGQRDLYTGYYHKDTTITDHHAVPGSWI
jgi:hypothetical protein